MDFSARSLHAEGSGYFLSEALSIHRETHLCHLLHPAWWLQVQAGHWPLPEQVWVVCRG